MNPQLIRIGSREFDAANVTRLECGAGRVSVHERDGTTTHFGGPGAFDAYKAACQILHQTWATTRGST